jgi:hypothetical protein
MVTRKRFNITFIRTLLVLFTVTDYDVRFFASDSSVSFFWGGWGVLGLFCLVFLLNQRWSPPVKLQVSDCCTSVLCDVPSIDVFYKWMYWMFIWYIFQIFLQNVLLLFRWFYSLPVQSHISCSTFVVSPHINSCVFIFFSTSFCVTFLSAGIDTCQYTCFLFCVFNYCI